MWLKKQYDPQSVDRCHLAIESVCGSPPTVETGRVQRRCPTASSGTMNRSAARRGIPASTNALEETGTTRRIVKGYMATDTGPGGSTALSPGEAFAVQGDETRLQILQTLGEADDPLAFSELFDRVEYDDTANFNYHLGKLEIHFVHKTGDGYALRNAGGRVVEAILSTDPFEARFTFTAGDDALTLTVDGDLPVVNVTRHDASEPVR